MAYLYLAVLCHLMLWSYVYGCSFPVGVEIPDYSFEETLEMAPVVVSGKDLVHTDSHNVTFLVSCVFKSGGLTIERELYILGVGTHSCGTSTMDVGQSYLVTLEKIPREDFDQVLFEYTDNYFRVYQPSAYDTGVFDATTENLNATTRLYALDNVALSLGQGGPDDHQCPVRNVTMPNSIYASTEASLSGASAVVMSRSLSVLVSLISLSLISVA